MGRFEATFFMIFFGGFDDVDAQKLGCMKILGRMTFEDRQWGFEELNGVSTNQRVGMQIGNMILRQTMV